MYWIIYTDRKTGQKVVEILEHRPLFLTSRNAASAVVNNKLPLCNHGEQLD